MPKAPLAGVILVGYLREMVPTPNSEMSPALEIPFSVSVTKKASTLASFRLKTDTPWFVLGIASVTSLMIGRTRMSAFAKVNHVPLERNA